MRRMIYPAGDGRTPHIRRMEDNVFTAIYLARHFAGGNVYLYGLIAVAAVYCVALLCTRQGRTKKGLMRTGIGLLVAAIPVDVGWKLAFMEYSPGFEAQSQVVPAFPGFLLAPLFYGLTFLMVRLLNDMFAE